MKTVHYLLIAAIATLFVACSEPTLEKTAKERICSHMKEALGARNKSIEVNNIETVFSDDSICILHYDLDAENFSGDKASFKMEYYILWTTLKEPCLKECFYFLEDKKSIIDRVIKFTDGKLPEEHKKRAHSLRVFAPALDAFSTVKVKLED